MFARLRPRRQNSGLARLEPVVFDDPEDVAAMRSTGRSSEGRNFMGRLRGARVERDTPRASEDTVREMAPTLQSSHFIEDAPQQEQQRPGWRTRFRLPSVSRVQAMPPEPPDDVVPMTPVAGQPPGKPLVLRKSRKRFPLDDDEAYFPQGATAEDAEAMRYEAGPSGVPHSDRGSVADRPVSLQQSNREGSVQHSRRSSLRMVNDPPGPPAMVQFPGGEEDHPAAAEYPPISQIEPRFRRLSGGKLVKRRRANTLEGPEVIPAEQPTVRQVLPARELPPTTDAPRTRRRLWSGGFRRRSGTGPEPMADAPPPVPPHDEPAQQRFSFEQEHPMIATQLVQSPVQSRTASRAPSVAERHVSLVQTGSREPSIADRRVSLQRSTASREPSLAERRVSLPHSGSRAPSMTDRRVSDPRSATSGGTRSRRQSDVPFPTQAEDPGYPAEMYHDQTVFREGSSIAPTMERGAPSLHEQRNLHKKVLTRRSARRSTPSGATRDEGASARGSEGGRSGSQRGSAGRGSGEHNGGGHAPTIHSPEETPGGERADPFQRHEGLDDPEADTTIGRRRGVLRFLPTFGRTREEMESPIEERAESDYGRAQERMAQGEQDVRNRRPSILGRMLRRKSTEGPSVAEGSVAGGGSEADGRSQQGTRGRRSSLLRTFTRRVEDGPTEVIGESPQVLSETGSQQGSRGRKSSLLGLFRRSSREEPLEEQPAWDTVQDEGSRTGTQRSRSSRRRRGSLLSRFRRDRMEEPEGSVVAEQPEFHDEGGQHYEEAGPHEYGGDGGGEGETHLHMHLHVPENVHVEVEPEHQAHVLEEAHADEPQWPEHAVVADAPAAPEPEGVPVIARSVRSVPPELPAEGAAAQEPLYYQVPPLDPSAPVVDATTFGMAAPGTRVKKEALFDGALVLYIDEEAKVDVGKLTPDGQVIFDNPVPEGWKIDAIITFPAGLALNPA
ncbi:hypothetical protein CALCODRAFT_490219 [Calocera cornea HHB12733]|uniref:Uncharacterized protein n=1 Tax=Calocera cornea HHB12733 TaxID=1353952 RepID=A0A165JXA3_9BASI|nr:hypothetical protein CALCODRAFT_490219 [Calocera cornea HHB12733]